MPADVRNRRPLREQQGARCLPRTVRIHRGVRGGRRSVPRSRSTQDRRHLGPSEHGSLRGGTPLTRSSSLREKTSHSCRKVARSRKATEVRSSRGAGRVTRIGEDSTPRWAAGGDERCPQLWAKRLDSIRRTRRERHWLGEATGRGFIPRATRTKGSRFEAPLRSGGPRGCAVDGSAREPSRMQRY